jgi:hypothetical protein
VQKRVGAIQTDSRRYDFSSHAFEAGRVAVVLGQHFGAELSLFHAVEVIDHQVIPINVRLAEVRLTTAECERLMMVERQRLRDLSHADLEISSRSP